MATHAPNARMVFVETSDGVYQGTLLREGLLEVNAKTRACSGDPIKVNGRACRVVGGGSGFAHELHPSRAETWLTHIVYEPVAPN